MATLSRVFFTISEAAARWGYSVADIAGWAHQGQLEIVTGIAPVQSGKTTLAGIVVIAAADILPMFRRSGLGPRELAVNRLRLPQETEWRMITNPAEGVMVSFDDLMITALRWPALKSSTIFSGANTRAGGLTQNTIGMRSGAPWPCVFTSGACQNCSKSLSMSSRTGSWTSRPPGIAPVIRLFVRN